MPTQAYEIVRQYAAGEVTEINAQILKLIQRKDLIKRLLDLLDKLEPLSATNGDPASYSAETETPAPEHSQPDLPGFQSIAHTEQAPGPGNRDLHVYLEALAIATAEEAGATASQVESFPDDKIAALAYRFWLERGCAHGHDNEDWVRAVQELRNAPSGN